MLQIRKITKNEKSELIAKSTHNDSRKGSKTDKRVCIKTTTFWDELALNDQGLTFFGPGPKSKRT